jgi:hypothetical protein
MNGWAVLAIGLLSLVACVTLLVVLAYVHDKRQKSAVQPQPRIPRVGDQYLILDHVWRVRSRAVWNVNGKVKYNIYRELVITENDPPFDGAIHTHDPVEFYEQWQFLGNPEEDKAKTQQMVAEVAIKHGISTEEVAAALSSDTGDIDMSKLPYRKGLPVPPVREQYPAAETENTIDE